eukprot:UN13720
MTASYEVQFDILPGLANKKWSSILYIGNEQGYRQPGIFLNLKRLRKSISEFKLRKNGIQVVLTKNHLCTGKNTGSICG